MVRNFIKLILVCALLTIFSSVSHAADISLSDLQSAIIENDYKKAHDLSRKLIALNPQRDVSDQAQYYLGLSLLRMGNYVEAKEILHNLIRYKPEKRVRDLAYLAIIDVHYLEEHFDEAIKDGKRLLRISGNSEFKSLIYLKLARANLRLANWTPAKNYLTKIISQYPESPEIHIAKQLLEEKQFFAVQIGSFLNREKAEGLISSLNEKGEYAYIIETIDGAGRHFYRVRVGKMSLLRDAKRLELKLADLGYPTRIYP